MPDSPPRSSPSPALSSASTLRPATEEEIADSLAFGLRYEGRKRVHHADTVMARITADRLVRHLQASGFVLMKRPAMAIPTTSHHGPPAQRHQSPVRDALDRPDADGPEPGASDRADP